MERTNPFIPIYRECNHGTTEEKYQRIKRGEVTLPRYIDVELTNMCNFRCRFCPTGTRSMHRAKGNMSDEVVEALVENIETFHIPGVRFIRWGEPTLHPRYIEILRRIKNVRGGGGTNIHINTNGALLDEKQIQQLIDIKLDSIKFSFQGADEGTYNEMRQGGDYQRLLNIVQQMFVLRGELPYPYIQISTTLTHESAEQIENFKKDVAGYCDYYNIGYTKLSHLNVEDMQISEEEKAAIRQIQKQETIQRVYSDACPEAFDKLSVNWNGDVTLCCGDYDNFMVIGNILDMNIQELFNSKAADQYRRMIVKGQHRQIKCCSECYETVPLQK